MLSARLNTSVINAIVTGYWRVSVLELTQSTQLDLVELAQQGKARPGDVIAAEYQSHGRGRLTRSFEAPMRTALLFSFYIEPHRKREQWGWIPLVAGVSVANALSRFDARVKWPNDILIGEKKVAGLIAQTIGNGIVIGIGINVGMKLSELPVPTATSLFIEGAHDLTRSQLLGEFLNIFEENFTTWDQDSDEIRTKYLKLSATIGRKVDVEYPDGRNEIGIAASISSNGELVLANGVHVQAADIIHLR